MHTKAQKPVYKVPYYLQFSGDKQLHHADIYCQLESDDHITLKRFRELQDTLSGIHFERNIRFQGAQINDENMIVDDSIFRGEVFDVTYDINMEEMRTQLNEEYEGKYGFAKKQSYLDLIFTSDKESFKFREELNTFTLLEEEQNIDGELR